MHNKRKIEVFDATMRDGCHPLGHQYSAEMLSVIAAYLEQANIRYMEVSHGDGLGGSSLHFGKSKLNDTEAIRTVITAAPMARVTSILLPGVGRLSELEEAKDAGLQTVRVATIAPEAGLAKTYIRAAKSMGLEAFGFLMLSSMITPDQLLEQAKKLESFGADAVYVVDSAGAMALDEVRTKVSLLRQHLSVRIGFHGHNNLGLSVGNTLVAVEEGADLVDGCLSGFGAGAGNAPTEVLVAALHKMGYETGVNERALIQAADYMLERVMPKPQFVERGALSLGMLGIQGSSLFTTLPLLTKYGVNARDLFTDLVMGSASKAEIEQAADERLKAQSKLDREGLVKHKNQVHFH
ncbi:4-hydroxy-2-oxovalerate aldolase [Paenibacillus sp. N1-5-1-14]|uniref:4-hydroxy-2-oxovalerate aldolase n=1 Tax=Paenibacillus radicibacter TaxID=2972488 RepID=UPI002158EACA|nr:4-hydroxy-2-oxovalerate aldolase [Paenibacillus radicibacter]MCR8644869.1 4-hydroxy-2-oxovalerate aldolase [Paenibacillus radicibacter]